MWMNNKQRVLASLEGKPVDRYPITVLYNFLYFRDHFAELSGKPQNEVTSWLAADPDRYLETFRSMMQQAPFETLQPEKAPSHEERTVLEFIKKEGKNYRHNRKTDEWALLDTVSGFPVDYRANEQQLVFDKKDIDDKIQITKSEKQVTDGEMDYIKAVVDEFGKDQFIISGGVVGTIYSCGWYVGQTNALAMLRTDPKFMDTLCHKILEKNIEDIRAFATAGGDAIYIDDATATNDMISVSDYERFSLPYMQAMVSEIHRLGHKAIVIYFGGISDRLNQIVATGADGLSMETTMKAFVNDIDQIANLIGSKITLFGNIDPVGVLESASDSALEAEIRRQTQAGNKTRGFIMCTGSPITPDTPIQRVRLFLDLAKNMRKGDLNEF